MLGVGREADKLTHKKVDVETTSEWPREECQTEDYLDIRNLTLLWYTESPNTVQHWSTNILAVTSKKTVGLGKDIMDMTSHTHFYSGKVKGTREFGVAFVVVRILKGNVLELEAVDERLPGVLISP